MALVQSERYLLQFRLLGHLMTQSTDTGRRPWAEHGFWRTVVLRYQRALGQRILKSRYEQRL